jgi:hypothetical protein
MKNNLTFTPHQLETWVAVLSVFDPVFVTRACVEIGLSEDPFPDLGKVVTRCERYRRQQSKEVFRDERVITGSLVSRVAEALELKVA